MCDKFLLHYALAQTIPHTSKRPLVQVDEWIDGQSLTSSCRLHNKAYKSTSIFSLNSLTIHVFRIAVVVIIIVLFVVGAGIIALTWWLIMLTSIFGRPLPGANREGREKSYACLFRAHNTTSASFRYMIA